MAQQTAVEQLIKMIDFEISMLEMDAGNCVEWSMSVMLGTLKKIKTKAEQAKQMEREQKEEEYKRGWEEATSTGIKEAHKYQ